METQSSSLHIAMCPWFAFGHMTQYLHISNKLAQKGHRISFFVPKNTQSKLQHLNLFPNLITFVPITVPRVDGLPPAAETTSDVPQPLFPLIMTAMDRAEPDFELLLRGFRPHLVFYDFAHWIPALGRRQGFKSVHFCIIHAATYGWSPDRRLGKETATAADLSEPPPGFPGSVRLTPREALALYDLGSVRFGSDLLFFDRLSISMGECDALAFKGCREIDGDFFDYIQRWNRKPLFLAGPLVPEPPPAPAALEERWAEWLGSFEPNSVVYCAMGSEWILEQAQIRELLSGLELAGFPFLAVLKPAGEEEFPAESHERGRVHVGWIQQQMILAHRSVGCFVTHCGSGSLAEALVNPCQLVMIPNETDHIFQARVIGNRLKAGLEVERDEEDGSFSGESLCSAIRTVMDEGESNEVGREIRANRAKLQKLLLNRDLEAEYIDDFSKKLQNLVLA